MPQNYTSQSLATKYYITSTKCDVPGQIVATADGSGGIPDGATLTFSQALQPAITDVTIQGLSGLYIALPPNAISGSKLVWSSTPATWQVNTTQTGPYVIVPKGQDLYLYTGNDIGPIVQVKSGGQIQGKENHWTLAKVD
ncbi:hypothetical protein ARMGADRAFT_1162001 [Armillaria gallica]|uniref:Ricin B lectin domain-containing protein n=1 Tax=Armillaria gallica TaxID=47427 RepID=A0A2H3DXW5_ARMGA|nr:hypothetical protein ARMGADRAFT_1162001 [Armillaria gallica]